jgi:arsenate reductase (glutaredoxin)
MRIQRIPVEIWHTPACSKSRDTLALIRRAGIEPVVVEYLKTPPSRERLADVIAAAGLRVREALRGTEAPYAALGLDDPALSDDALLDAMIAHPILIQRPFVIAPAGTTLCRPPETVLDLLPPRTVGCADPIIS